MNSEQINMKEVDFSQYKRIRYIGEGSTNIVAWIVLAGIWLLFIPIGLIIGGDKTTGFVLVGGIGAIVFLLVGLLYSQVIAKRNPVLKEKDEMRKHGVLRIGTVVDIRHFYNLTIAGEILKEYLIVEYKDTYGNVQQLQTALIDPPMKAKERFAYKGHHIPQERVQALVEKQVQYLKGKKVLLYEMNGKVFADRIEK